MLIPSSNLQKELETKKVQFASIGKNYPYVNLNDSLKLKYLSAYDAMLQPGKQPEAEGKNNKSYPLAPNIVETIFSIEPERAATQYKTVTLPDGDAMVVGLKSVQLAKIAEASKDETQSIDARLRFYKMLWESWSMWDRMQRNAKISWNK